MPRKKWTPDDVSPEFWQVMAKVKGSRKALQAVVDAMPQGDLYELYREYDALRVALTDSRFYWEGASDDAVEDVVEWVIAQGPELYKDIYAHPAKMPHERPAFEGVGFGHIMNNTFIDRFGKDLYELFHRPQ